MKKDKIKSSKKKWKKIKQGEKIEKKWKKVK